MKARDDQTARRLISDSGLLDSASGAALILPKSPKTVDSGSIGHGSPLRPSTRSIAPDLNAAVVINGESARIPPKSVSCNESRKLPKRPAKSP
jgi:hypothetical protein